MGRAALRARRRADDHHRPVRRLIRAVAPFAAGAAGMRYGRFLAASLVGTAAWSAVFILLGYALSRSLERAEDAASVVGLAVGALVAAWVIRNAVRRRRRRLG